MTFKITTKQRLIATIIISFAFFVSEITVAYLTKSLALVADAFHYMNDLAGFVVALVALIVSERSHSPQEFSFGWQRAKLLGAFFNGVFLLALGISIFLQSIERFVAIQHVENPKLVLIMGCVGLTLNIISALFLHEHDHDHGHGHGHDHGEEEQAHAHSVGHSHGHSHSRNHSHGHGQSDGHNHSHSRSRSHSHSHSHGHGHTHEVEPEYRHSTDHELAPLFPHAEHRHNIARLKAPGRDLGMMGVLVHVIGDALNNLGVIIAALVIWLTQYPSRYYADPGVSMGIACMILISALPLVKNSGTILLQSAPRGVNVADVKHDLEKIPGIESVHELHVWRLDQKKAIATAHIVVSDENVANFMQRAKTVSECLHAYGIHSATIQPELINSEATGREDAVSFSAASTASTIVRRRLPAAVGACQMLCGKGLCEGLMCCSSTVSLSGHEE